VYTLAFDVVCLFVFWGGVGGIANNWMMIPAQLGLQSNFE
jgi:hypothetical protein